MQITCKLEHKEKLMTLMITAQNTVDTNIEVKEAQR